MKIITPLLDPRDLLERRSSIGPVTIPWFILWFAKKMLNPMEWCFDGLLIWLESHYGHFPVVIPNVIPNTIGAEIDFVRTSFSLASFTLKNQDPTYPLTPTMAFSLQIAVQQTPKSPTPSRMPIEPEVKFTYYVTCWFITSGWKLGPGEATKTTQTTHTTINQDLGQDLRVRCDVLILYISYLYMYIYMI